VAPLFSFVHPNHEPNLTAFGTVSADVNLRA
jgi:hypothetical protein